MKSESAVLTVAAGNHHRKPAGRQILTWGSGKYTKLALAQKYSHTASIKRSIKRYHERTQTSLLDAA